MLDESVLDTVDRLAAADRNNLLRQLAMSGAQMRESVQLTEEAGVEGYFADMRPRAVLVCCDASADTAARAVTALADQPDCASPVVVQSASTLPTWAGPADALLVAAHVGGDERVLSVVQAASRRGVPLIGIGPAPSPLEEACLRARCPYVPVPGGRFIRAALWGLLTPLVIAAGRLGLVPLRHEDVVAAGETLDALSARCRPTSDTFVNPAKSLALELAPSLPVIWAASPLAGAAAYRMVGQLAGNATLAATAGVLPVASRMLGGVFDGSDAVDTDDLFRDRVDESEPRRPRLVLLRDVEEEPDVRAGLETATAALNQRGVPVTEVSAEEGGPFTRLASLIGLLDFVTVYVGLVLGVDPSAPRTGQAPA